MAAEQALSELLEVSEEVTAAVLFDRDAAVLAASVDDDAASDAAAIAAAMLSYADSLRDEPGVLRVEAVADEGSVFVLRDGNRAVVATTKPSPLQGLVYHDLRTCLRKSATRSREKARA